MKKASEIIRLWPNAAEMSRDVGVRYMTVRNWMTRESIPGKHWSSIVAAAKRRGIDGVTLDALAKCVRKDAT